MKWRLICYRTRVLMWKILAIKIYWNMQEMQFSLNKRIIYFLNFNYWKELLSENIFRDLKEKPVTIVTGFYFRLINFHFWILLTLKFLHFVATRYRSCRVKRIITFLWTEFVILLQSHLITFFIISVNYNFVSRKVSTVCYNVICIIRFLSVTLPK